MGRIIKFQGNAMQIHQEVSKKLKAFAQGKMTWAEVEGMTFEEAKAIAQVGCDLAAAGRIEEARIIFEGLVEGNPKDSASRAALGTVYQRLGRFDDAVAEYTAAVEHDGDNPVALANRGEIRLRRGDRGGLEDLFKAVRADPQGETAAGRRARSLVKAIELAAAKQAKAQVGS